MAGLPLAPADFAKVNPNTGTAPVFRTRRDAEITRRIYEQHPVLVDRSEGEERRARARLDALYFHLYGLGREDAAYVLGTFPIVRREDEAQFGRYRTRDLILAYMNALAAGDAETVVAA